MSYGNPNTEKYMADWLQAERELAIHCQPLCSQCGGCCSAEPCCIAIVLWPNQSHCPALELSDEKYWCGLVSNTKIYAKEVGIHWPDADYDVLGYHFGDLLGIGKGCDSG